MAFETLIRGNLSDRSNGNEFFDFKESQPHIEGNESSGV